MNIKLNFFTETKPAPDFCKRLSYTNLIPSESFLVNSNLIHACFILNKYINRLLLL